jgi:hypothetical protein
VVAAPFSLSRTDVIATAGSCFAQHISRTLVEQGFRYLVTETYQARAGTSDEGYGMFPARFGNLYTSRQLVQLFDRAYGLLLPQAGWWRGKGGGFIDPFRPRIQAAGFASVELLQADRERHLAAVRRMFEYCQVFIFTLGLTETWVSPADGSAFPLAPGVVAADAADSEAEFRNLSVAEVIADLDSFLGKFRTVNPAAKVILTVSPVPLIATYEDRHILVSTIASKSILRAAAEDICRQHPHVAYFPSYEIITGPQAASRYYAADLREVTAEGVATVMAVFARHYLPSATATSPADNARGAPASPQPTVPATDLAANDAARLAAVAAIICDEEAIVS